MKVYVGFSTSNLWVSRIIRWATRSKCSHTFLIYEHPFYQCPFVVEAASVGFREIPLVHFKKEGNTIVAVYEPKADWSEATKETGRRWLGEGYNWSGLFGMAIVKLGELVKRKWRNPGLSAKANFCSEANAKIARLAGEPGFDLDPGETDPEELMEFFERSGCTKR